MTSFDDLRKQATLSDDRFPEPSETSDGWATFLEQREVADAATDHALRTALTCPEIQAMRDAAQRCVTYFAGMSDIPTVGYQIEDALAAFDKLLAEAQDV